MKVRIHLKTRGAILLFLLAAICTAASARTIYVDADALGANDGSSWVNAFNYLQDALATAQYGDEIRVAQGIYKPDSNSVEPNGSGDRTSTFQLINGLTLKGGYAGFGEHDPNVRDIEVYETILSGDLDGNDVDVNDPADLLDEPTRAENSYHVVTGSGTDATAVLDGLIVMGGNANETSPYPSPHESGGGIYNESACVTLTNCTFRGNSATRGGGMANYSSSPTISNSSFYGNFAYHVCWGDVCSDGFGGGMYNYQSNPMLTNCAFSENSATISGGGMFNKDSRPTVTSCTFSRNSAVLNRGGGMYNDYSSPTVSGCIFSGNSAFASGGGMVNTKGSPLVANCIFSENSVGSGGGGIHNDRTSATIIHCVFSGNSSRYNGGGMKNYQSDVMLTNCILWGNRDSGGTDESAQIDGTTAVVNYCAIQGLTGALGGIGNIGDDPLFADSNNDDYHLKSQAGRWEPNEGRWTRDVVTSPCIDTGDIDSPIGLEPFPNGGVINMGAYGGTAEASKSYFGEPVCETIVAGDINGDCKVNFKDFALMAFHWLRDENQ